LNSCILREDLTWPVRFAEQDATSCLITFCPDNASGPTTYDVGSTVLATASFFEAGKSFINKIKADNSRQIEFEAISGHCPSPIPNPIHNANPITVKRYMPVEMSLVLRDLIIFHAWGAKLAVETAAAKAPRIVVNDICLQFSSLAHASG
jgi:hypothetical protein